MLSTSVVVASDLSKNSEPAMRAAAWLCRELGLSATLTYSVEPEAMHGVMEKVEGGDKLGLKGHALEALGETDRKTFEGIATEVRIIEGARAAAEAICDVAAEIGAQLVVMGTHGRTAFEFAAFGSTATSVVRHAQCDVLTVRPPLEGETGLDVKLSDWVLSLGQAHGVQRVLCPVDFSTGSDNALARAVGLAKQFDCALTLLHIVKYPFWASREEYTLAAERARGSAREAMRALVEQTRDAGVNVDSHITDGQPATVIKRFAEERKMDLVVMGTHGRTGLKRWAIGSVAERIVRASRIPVWCVRLQA